MDQAQNATNLFQSPSRDRHNSESWWSALFSILLLYEAKTNPSFSLPVYTYAASSGFWWGENLHVANLAFQNVQVEPRLSANALMLSEWPNKFLNLKPDLLIFQPEDKRVDFIETKTIGATIARNVQLYQEASGDLHARTGWDVRLYYLISHGHENNLDWRLIESNRLKVILWEEVLRAMVGTPLEPVFDCDLSTYATRPAVRVGGDGTTERIPDAGPRTF